jgi:hypothetical protein
MSLGVNGWPCAPRRLWRVPKRAAVGVQHRSGGPEALGERRLTCPDRETWLQAPPIGGTTATNDGGIVVGRQSFAAKSLFHIQRLNQ